MSVIDIVVAVVIGLCIILLALAARGIFGELRKSAKPGVQEILNALDPYIWRAIMAGERTVVWGMDQAEAWLEGADKKAVADSVYALLPDTVVVGGLPLPIGAVRSFVPREVFEARVKDLYDSADAFIQRNEAYLKGQVDLLKPWHGLGGGREVPVGETNSS